MPKISEKELNRMAMTGAKVKRKPVSRVPTASEIAAQTPTEAPEPAPAAPPDSSIPLASMQAMGAMNQQLARVVEQNTRAIAGLHGQITQPKPKLRRLKVVRDRMSKLIAYCDLLYEGEV